MGFKKQAKRFAKKAKAPAKRIAQAAARQAVRELRGGAKSLIARNPMVNMGLRTLVGNGDYKTNALMRGGGNNHAPSMGSSRTVVSRREYIGRVVSSSTAGAFKITKYTINPGSSTTFPWLAQLAANYESYRPLGLVFEFKSTSGESVGSTNTALGAVVMGTQYNSFAPDPTNRQQVEALHTAISVAPYENALCGVECKPSSRQATTLLIRNAYSASTPGAAYDSLFDLGDFFICSDGCQGTSVALGELWVTYKIELNNPILSPVFSWNQRWGGEYTQTTGVGLQIDYWSEILFTLGTRVSYTPWTVASTGNSKLYFDSLISGQSYRFFLRYRIKNAGTMPMCSVVQTNLTLTEFSQTPGYSASAGDMGFLSMLFTALSNDPADFTLNWTSSAYMTDLVATLELVPNSLG